MNQTKTCGTCFRFDAEHEMCLYSIFPSSFGEVFEQRSPDSPACPDGYCRKPEAGEMIHLFQQNHIQPCHPSKHWDEGKAKG